MNNLKCSINDFMERENSHKNLVLVLIGVIFFLLGMVAGFFIAPVKEGLKVGCGNFNTANNFRETDGENQE